MHFYAIVALPPGVDPDDMDKVECHVADAMAPYDENSSEDGWWDWWQIGGRWTGALDGYDAANDPALTEPCKYCDQTGMRDDAVGQEMRAKNPEFTCNACSGTGRRPLWPTQFPQRRGDVQRLGDVRAKLTEAPPYTIVAAERAILGERYVDDPSAEHGYRVDSYRSQVVDTIAELSDDCIVVVVDYHS